MAWGLVWSFILGHLQMQRVYAVDGAAAAWAHLVGVVSLRADL